MRHFVHHYQDSPGDVFRQSVEFMRMRKVPDEQVREYVEAFPLRYGLEVPTLPQDHVEADVWSIADEVARAIQDEAKRINESITETDVVLVTGELPPHVIHTWLLQTPATIWQIVRAGPHGDFPPHARHLALAGLKVVAGLEELPRPPTVLVAHGLVADNQARVSPLLPKIAAQYPTARIILVPGHHLAPHMSHSIPLAGLDILPQEV